ncbi:MAG: RsmB/NOP family class I SAM-dependent RNA methyltransferase [Pseudomonadota bacterium]
MTPGARVAAAIAIIDQIKDGTLAEAALSRWARSSRFAGSKDRAAIRDHVFDVLRARRSLGDGSGRDLMARLLARDGEDPERYFTGQGHAPRSLGPAERSMLSAAPDLSEAAAHDMPDWLWPHWVKSLGVDAKPAALVLQRRAPVFLRINTRRASAESVISSLAAEDIAAAPHDSVPGCLRVMQNARRIKTSQAFAQGWIELQDASSQFAVKAVAVPPAARVLDYCAGGGGKALAFADLYDAAVFAHDVAPQRMVDVPERAARAGVKITRLATADLAGQPPFDVVFCDAPCSGSGTWRRTPDAKWALTQQRLMDLQQAQSEVLETAAGLVAPGGNLVYATCSVLASENHQRVDAFIEAQPDWQIKEQRQLLPDDAGDGFFLCNMIRKSHNL